MFAMKRCVACREIKTLANFNKNKARCDGLQQRCRPCDNARSRAYHHGPNKARHLATIRRNLQARRRILRAIVSEHLRSHPCVDCGFSDVRALDFDHLRDKEGCISAWVRYAYVSVERLRAEMAKCEIRCSNCHRIVTCVRRQSSRSLVLGGEMVAAPDC